MKAAEPEKIGFSAERLERINTLMHRYVDNQKMAGVVACVFRKGHIANFTKYGYRDIKLKTPMELDTIFRIYSMTKPISCTALMMLYEDSLFNLQDPVSEFIPDFKNTMVLVEEDVLEEPIRPITIQDLLRHTAGLSHVRQPLLLPFHFWDRLPRGPLEDIFSSRKRATDHSLQNLIHDLIHSNLTNQEITSRIANLPLMFHPGTKWHYSVATDVVGYLVEVLSGKSLSDFMKESIFEPLNMVDTGFDIAEDKLGRFATLYGKTADEDLGILDEPATSDYLAPAITHAGGQGLISTAGDYLRFSQFLLNQGELDGIRLLGPRTVALMTCNHLPIDLLPIAFEGFKPMLGMGYGLGFGIMLDAAQTGLMGSTGDYGWGGQAETNFWIDPKEELIAILMTQYLPSMTYPIREEFRTAVYQALIE